MSGVSYLDESYFFWFQTQNITIGTKVSKNLYLPGIICPLQTNGYNSL
jgi:hypothetical protein